MKNSYKNKATEDIFGGFYNYALRLWKSTNLPKTKNFLSQLLLLFQFLFL